MSTLEFVATLVSAVAWPAAVVVLLLILRPQIIAAMGSVRTLRGFGFEIELERARAEVESAIADIQPETPASENSLELVLNDPRETVRASYQRLEVRLRALTAATDAAVPDSFAELISEARTHDVISERVAEAVRGLRVAHNAALRRSDWAIGPAEAAEFSSLVDATLVAMDK